MKLWKKIILLMLMLGILAGGTCIYLGYQQYKEVIASIRVKDKVAQIENQTDFVPYEDISPDLLHATIAIEDHRFYSHNGFDVIATTRALFDNVFSQGIVGGGSTITQQLAKNMYFDYDQSFIRKISELFVVHDLESQFSKEEILALYVNIINYGDNHIGIKAASEGYFQVSPDDLSLAQASMLAGLPQSPSNFQLSNHYEQAVVRQKQVLNAMTREGYIEDQQMQEVLAMP